MERKKSATEIVLYVLLGCAAVWEFWAVANNWLGDTFSAIIRRLSIKQPFIVLMCGLIMGHLFWPLTDEEANAPNP